MSAASLPPHAAALRDTLALALDRPTLATPPEAWRALFEAAGREGCGAVLWHRARGRIRDAAPADVVSGFRAHAVRQAALLGQRLALLGATLDALGASGVRAVVLKGMPLSQRLYGDPFLRPSADVDLWIDAGERHAARACLLAEGWQLVEGAAPWEEAFERLHLGRVERLELHTFLLGDRLAHLPQPPMTDEPLVVEGRTLRVPAPALQALMLATHLSSHRRLPLLFLLDYHALWTALAPADREAARALARGCRAAGYLEYAASLAERVPDVVDAPGAAAALAALAAVGFAEGRGEMGHPARRDLRFAVTLSDAASVTAGWLLPPHLRYGPRGPVRETLARVGRLARGAARGFGAPREVSAAPAPAAASLHATPEELVALVRDVVGAGGSMWMKARGRSMHPAVPSGARIRLEPLPPRALAPGEVAMATLPGGLVVVHRVVVERDGTVLLRGDGNVLADPPVGRAAVHALATAVEIDGVARPLAGRPGPSPLVRLRRIRAALVRP